MKLRSRPVACIDAASSDTSWQVRVGAGEIAGVDLRLHPPNIWQVATLLLKVGLAQSVVLWLESLQGDVLVLAVRGGLLGSDEV